MTQIREATPLDHAAILRMAHRFTREVENYRSLLGNANTPALLELLKHVNQLGTVFVADAAHDAVGMVAVVAVPNLMTGEPYCDEVVWWVDPEWRTGSAGPRLLDRAECWAAQNQLKYVKMVAPHGSGVGRFYERRGYQPIETAYVKVL